MELFCYFYGSPVLPGGPYAAVGSATDLPCLLQGKIKLWYIVCMLIFRCQGIAFTWTIAWSSSIPTTGHVAQQGNRQQLVRRRLTEVIWKRVNIRLRAPDSAIC